MRRYWFPHHYAAEAQRARVPLGFLLTGLFLSFSDPAPWSLALGLPVALMGLLVRAWAAGHLRKDQELAESGPYAYTRNPLYFGTLLAGIGFSVASRQLGLGALFGGAFLLVYVPAIEMEEQHLRKLFAGYDAYAGRVPLLMPRLGAAPAGPRWSFALYRRNREYQALLGFAVGCLFLVWRAGLLTIPS